MLSERTMAGDSLSEAVTGVILSRMVIMFGAAVVRDGGKGRRGMPLFAGFETEQGPHAVGLYAKRNQRVSAVTSQGR